MNFLRSLTRVLERLLMALLAGIFVLVSVLVVLRYVFSGAIIGGHEALLVAFIYTTAVGAAIALWRDEHIRIDYFAGLLPERLQPRLVQLRLVLLVVLQVAIVGASVVWISRTGQFLMPTLGLPQWVAQISVPFGATLSILYCLQRLWADRP